jgi:hypothetical protein
MRQYGELSSVEIIELVMTDLDSLVEELQSLSAFLDMADITEVSAAEESDGYH